MTIISAMFATHEISIKYALNLQTVNFILVMHAKAILIVFSQQYTAQAVIGGFVRSVSIKIIKYIVLRNWE